MNSPEHYRYRWVLVAFMAALVIIQGFGASLLMARHESVLLRQSEREIEHELKLLESLISEPLLKHDYVTVVRFLDHWGADNPDIASIEAEAGNGFILTRFERPETGAPTVKAVRTIEHDGSVLTVLRIEHSLKETYQQLRTLRWQMAAGGTLLTLALGFTLWRILAHLGLRPLEQEIDRRIAVENELRSHRNQLDELVHRRTQDLEQTVAELRDSRSALMVKSADLETSNLELEQFIHVMSHDLKGPLRAVSHLTAALEEDWGDALPPGARSIIPTLRSRVQRLHGLIDALLACSRAGRQGLIELVDLNQLVGEVIESLALPAGVTCDIAPLPTLETDALRLRQVFANLIENAVAHHDRPDAHLEIEARNLGEKGYEFAVCDDGPGIPPQYREQVFELFRTLAARDRKEHSGMGLTLVKKIVESRGGKVVIEAREPRGTVMRFSWPVCVPR